MVIRVVNFIVGLVRSFRIRRIDKYTKSEQNREKQTLELLDAAYKDGRLEQLASQYYDDSND